MYDYAEIIKKGGFVKVHVTHNDWENVDYEIKEGVFNELRATLHNVFLYYLSFGETIVHIGKNGHRGKKLIIFFPNRDFECIIAGYKCRQILSVLVSLAKEFKMHIKFET